MVVGRSSKGEMTRRPDFGGRRCFSTGPTGPRSLRRFLAGAHHVRRLLLHRSHRRLHEFHLQPDTFDRRFRLRELAGVIAKRRDVSLGGVECLSRELKPSGHRTIELADIVMREIAQVGKPRTGFIRHTVSSGLNTHARTSSAFPIVPPPTMGAASRVFQYRLANFSIGKAYGDSSGPVFPGCLRASELHPGRKTVPRDAAFALTRDPASGEGVRRISVRPAPLEGSADRARQARSAL